ncbi:MAG: hypothetical protein NZM07_11945 [Elioraea sp.]|nr:hypothetical protein [Elioraea sp.]
MEFVLGYFLVSAVLAMPIVIAAREVFGIMFRAGFPWRERLAVAVVFLFVLILAPVAWFLLFRKGDGR